MCTIFTFRSCHTHSMYTVISPLILSKAFHMWPFDVSSMYYVLYAHGIKSTFSYSKNLANTNPSEMEVIWTSEMFWMSEICWHTLLTKVKHYACTSRTFHRSNLHLNGLPSLCPSGRLVSSDVWGLDEWVLSSIYLMRLKWHWAWMKSLSMTS